MSKILVFGEILYDLFEEKAEIGGAPFCFAAHIASLGDRADLVSAVGRDAMGYMADKELRKKHVGSEFVAKTDLPTGYSTVTLNGVTPEYELKTGVAYDHIPVPGVCEDYDALYFGTLAQRSAMSKNTLETLLQRSYKEVFLDVNIRPPFCTRELLEMSLRRASIVKITREEAFVVMPYPASDEEYCRTLLSNYQNLKEVVLTFGKEGSMVMDREQGVFRSTVPPSAPLSTVGAGDAFGACYLHHRLKGSGIPKCIEAATLLSDFVVTKLGAVPELPEELKKRIV